MRNKGIALRHAVKRGVLLGGLDWQTEDPPTGKKKNLEKNFEGKKKICRSG